MFTRKLNFLLKNRNFYSKMKTLVKNRNFGHKSKFLSKSKILTKNPYTIGIGQTSKFEKSTN